MSSSITSVTPTSSGNELNSSFASDCREMAEIECGDTTAIALGTRDHCGIGIAKWQIMVTTDKLDDPMYVGIDKFHHECASCNVPEKLIQPSRSEPCLEEVADLRENSSRNDERSGLTSEKCHGAGVIGISLVDCRNQG